MAKKPLLNSDHMAQSTLDEILQQCTYGAEATYEMGRLLDAVHEHELYLQLGYDTFKLFAEGTLPFTYATAHTRRNLYRDFKRLKYTYRQSIKVLEALGTTATAAVLKGLGEKMTPAELGGRLEFLKKQKHSDDISRVNFYLSKSEAKQIEGVLEDYGLHHSVNGQRICLTTSLLKLVEEHMKLKRNLLAMAQQNEDKGIEKRKLRAVG